MRLVERTQEALQVGIGYARDGVRLGDLGAGIEDCIHEAGFSVVRDFVGHGVGRKLHEEPQVPNYGRRGTGPKLKAGMVLAIEPMVNFGVSGVRILADRWTVVTLDGKPSAHFEHTVLVTEAEPEILTVSHRQEKVNL
jgi:methionyl aminopeptidase